MANFAASSSSSNNNNNKIRVPLGFVFVPTDTELVVSYLMRKMRNEELPSQDVIKEVDLYSYADPYALIASHEFMAKEYEWYFFTRRNMRHGTGSRVNRTTTNGFWKASGGEKSISDNNGEAIGMKMSLVFHYNNPTSSNKPVKTNWLMTEFKLKTNNDDNKKGDDIHNWVICKVYNNSKDNLQLNPGAHRQQQISFNANNSEAIINDDEVQMASGYNNQQAGCIGQLSNDQVMMESATTSDNSTFQQQHLEDQNNNNGGASIFEGMLTDEDLNDPNLSASIDDLFNEEDRLFFDGLWSTPWPLN